MSDTHDTDMVTDDQDAIYEVPDKIKGTFDFEFLSNIEWNQKAYFATGGMAEVYQGSLKRGDSVMKVAIKTMRGAHCAENEEKLEKYLRRLKREEKRLNQAAHPNVVEFLGISPWHLITPAPTPGLVSAFYEGGTITEFLRKRGNVSPEHRLRMILEIAKGLEFLHSQDLELSPPKYCMIHGDLKPNNVLIKKDGIAAICDFGQARLLGIGNESGLTTGLNITPRYLAPEVFEALENEADEDDEDMNGEGIVEKLDRSGRLTTMEGDIYSFGLTSLEIATDLPPFRTVKPQRLAAAVRSGKWALQKKDYEKISEINGLWEILERCWDRVPSYRPQMPIVVNELYKLEN